MQVCVLSFTLRCCCNCGSLPALSLRMIICRHELLIEHLCMLLEFASSGDNVGVDLLSRAMSGIVVHAAWSVPLSADCILGRRSRAITCHFIL